MGGERPDAFLAALPDRLAAAVGVGELGAATRPQVTDARATDRELHGDAIPWARHGYAVGPPYDGDADGPVWAERDLREPAW